MTDKLKSKKFVYQITIEDLPHNADTIEHAYGEGAVYSGDYPEDSHARDDVDQMFQDAILFCLQMQTLSCKKSEDEISAEAQKQYREWLKSKEELYRKLQKSLTLVEISDIE